MTGRRVVVTTRCRALLGGAEQHLRALLPRLRARGYEVALAVEQDATSGRLDEGLDLPVWSAARLGTQGHLDALAAWRPDVVYQHGVDDVHLESALLDAYPAVLFAHAYRGTCISGTKRHGFPRPIPCQRVLGPGCLWRYLPRRCGGLSPVTGLREYARQKGRLALARRYRAVVVGSRAMRDEYLRHGLGEEQVFRVPLFADVERDAEPPSRRAIAGRILMVGRLTELKGGVVLVRALRLAGRALGHPLELVVAGDGPDRRRMERAALGLGVAVSFAGWVGREELVRLMREADLLAVPSTWPEPFGLVGLEGAAVGLPAAGFAMGGIPDWCEPGFSGELAPPPPTSSGLAEAIVRALGDPDQHARLRRGAWETAGRFGAEAHLAAVSALLDAAAT